MNTIINLPFLTKKKFSQDGLRANDYINQLPKACLKRQRGQAKQMLV